jgi:hypothetical protein
MRPCCGWTNSASDEDAARLAAISGNAHPTPCTQGCAEQKTMIARHMLLVFDVRRNFQSLRVAAASAAAGIMAGHVQGCPCSEQMSIMPCCDHKDCMSADLIDFIYIQWLVFALGFLQGICTKDVGKAADILLLTAKQSA